MIALISIRKSSNSRADEGMESKLGENKQGSSHELPQGHGLNGLSTSESIGQKEFHKRIV